MPPSPESHVVGELRSLADAYAVGVDRGDVSRFLSAFAPDAVLEVWRPDVPGAPASRRQGHAVLAEVPPALDRYVSTSHQVGECEYRWVAEGEAEGVVRCQAHHVSVLRDPEGRPIGAHDDVMTIRYLDEYRCDGEGRWRISRRQVMIDRIDRVQVDPDDVQVTRGRP